MTAVQDDPQNIYGKGDRCPPTEQGVPHSYFPLGQRVYGHSQSPTVKLKCCEIKELQLMDNTVIP